MRKIRFKSLTLYLKRKKGRFDLEAARPKIIGLSIAILLHVLLVLYLRQAKIIIKILPFEKETNIIIATYPEVSMPPNLAELIKEPPISEDLAGRPGESGQAQLGRVPGEPGASGTGAEGRQPLAESSGSEKPIVPFDLDAYLASGSSEVQTSSGVRINLSRLRPTSGKYSFSLKLFVSPEPEPGEGKETVPSGLKSDVYQYAAPRAYEQPGKGLRFSETGRVRPGIPGAIDSDIPVGYRYNIKPWAEKVVSIIQTRWVLPQLAILPKNKNVAMILVVDREGQLLSLDMVTSTSSEVLDQAAATAVRLASPFPPLPEDFPGKSLEFYLVFTYHD